MNIRTVEGDNKRMRSNQHILAIRAESLVSNFVHVHVQASARVNFDGRGGQLQVRQSDIS